MVFHLCFNTSQKVLSQTDTNIYALVYNSESIYTMLLCLAQLICQDTICHILQKYHVNSSFNFKGY